MHQPKLLSNLRTALLPIAVVLSLGAAGACTRTPAASATTPPADPGAATAPSAQTLAKAKPNDVDGRDLMEVLTAPDAAPPSLLLAGHGSRADDCWQTLVVDEWKLVVRWQDGTRREMLFDLTADPGETRDVAADHPARVAALRDELLRRIDPEQPVTLRPPLGDDHLSPAARRKLRSLGYIH